MHRRHFLEALASTALTACASRPPLPGTTPTPSALPRPSLAPLSEATFASRVERARALAHAVGADSVFVTSGTTNFEYLTGADLDRSERLIALVVAAQGPLLLVAPSFEVERARRSLRIHADVRGWQESESPYDVLRAALGTPLPNVMLIEAHTEYGTAESLSDSMPGVKLVDGVKSLESLRIVKDEEEVARLRRAIAITHEVFERAFASLRTGVADRDVSAAIARAFKDAGYEGYALVQFGAQSALPHGRPSGATLQAESAVLIDGGCRVDGYWSDITRTRWFGTAPAADFTRIVEIVMQAQRAGIARARVGTPAQDVDRAARAVIAQAGFGAQFTHRTGHGLGMDGHEPIYLVDGNTTPLVPGCVFTVEPGIYLPGQFGVRIEDDVLCTSGGPVVMTGA